MSEKQPKALELAAALDENADLDSAEGANPNVCNLEWAAAKELLRLHALNAELLLVIRSLLNNCTVYSSAIEASAGASKMTDRELLELAAKAEGHVYPWFVANRDEMVVWNPLEDDGDALRLAMKLKLAVDTNTSRAVSFGGTSVDVCEAPHGEPVATRRAIVRVAAEIGK